MIRIWVFLPNPAERGSSAFNRGYTLKDESYTIISNPSRHCFVANAPRNDSKQAVFLSLRAKRSNLILWTRYWKTHQPRLTVELSSIFASWFKFQAECESQEGLIYVSPFCVRDKKVKFISLFLLNFLKERTTHAGKPSFGFCSLLYYTAAKCTSDCPAYSTGICTII